VDIRVSVIFFDCASALLVSCVVYAASSVLRPYRSCGRGARFFLNTRNATPASVIARLLVQFFTCVADGLSAAATLMPRTSSRSLGYADKQKRKFCTRGYTRLRRFIVVSSRTKVALPCYSRSVWHVLILISKGSS